MTDELKPCPFCGGKPQPRLDDCINGKMVENPMFYIACENLGCGVWPEAEGRYETQYDAIVAAWNRRALPTHAAQLAAALALPEVAALVKAAVAAKIILAEYEPHPLPALGNILRALAALEARHD